MALPEKYGKWYTIYMIFSRWSKNGTIEKIFEALQEMNIIYNRTGVLCPNSTGIRVHSDAAGARKSSGKQSIKCSKEGLTTKIRFVCTHVFSISHQATVMMLRREENC